MKLLYFLPLLLLSTNTFGQDTLLRPGEHLHPFVMQYTGSESNVDPFYKYQLEFLVQYINQSDSIEIHVRGHVCCGPSQRLSKKRAKKVYKYLLREGIDPTKITYRGYSDTAPRNWPEKTKDDEMANRRVDFVIRVKDS